MQFRSTITRSAAALLVVTATAAAQKPHSVELGIDGGIGFRSASGTSTVTQINLPVQLFRIGFMMSDGVSFEPSGALNYFKGTGSSTLTNLNASLLFHLSTNAARSRAYVRPFLGFISSSFTSSSGVSSSTTQLDLGAGIGVKVPVSDRFGTRWEANVTRVLNSGNLASYTAVNLLAGLSFFIN